MEKQMFGNLDSFLKRRGADERLIKVIKNYEIPNAVIKDLSLNLRFGKEDYFWEKLNDPENTMKIYAGASLCYVFAENRRHGSRGSNSCTAPNYFTDTISTKDLNRENFHFCLYFYDDP